MNKEQAINKVKELFNELQQPMKLRDIKQIRITNLEKGTDGECYLFTFDNSGGYSEKKCTGFGIDLAESLLDKPEQRIIRVIVHELIHTTKGNYNHNLKFHKTLNKAMQLINS